MNCCQTMKNYMELKCSLHGDDPHDCPDYVVAKFGDSIGIPIRDGGSSYSEINFCPWCGRRIGVSFLRQILSTFSTKVLKKAE